MSLPDFLKFLEVTHGLFKELGRHAKKGGSPECPDCGACKESVGKVLIECASYDSQRQNFGGYLGHVLLQMHWELFVTVALR